MRPFRKLSASWSSQDSSSSSPAPCPYALPSSTCLPAIPTPALASTPRGSLLLPSSTTSLPAFSLGVTGSILHTTTLRCRLVSTAVVACVPWASGRCYTAWMSGMPVLGMLVGRRQSEQMSLVELNVSITSSLLAGCQATCLSDAFKQDVTGKSLWWWE
jgi:hypothetical protein